jgi:cytochrome c oxidase assembly factor CtaG
VVAFALYHAGLFAWHIPALYTAALRHEMIHLLQHASFILGGVAFWGVIVAPEPHLVRATLGHRLVMVLAASVLGWLLSFALALAERPLYPIYLEVPRLWGLSALDDLRLGGGVMWVIGNMMYGLTVLLLVIALMNREARQFGRQAPEGP